MIGDTTQSRYGHDGWDPPQDMGEFSGRGDGGSSGSSGPFRFKLPVPKDNQMDPGKPQRRRFMILGAPFYMWEHGTYKLPGVPRGVFNAICLRQGNVGGECPLCDDKRWPSYGAYFTVVDMGIVRYVAGKPELLPEIWTDREGRRRESQFQKRLMVAKKGGKDKPGKMLFFEDQRNRRGDLTGCIYETIRMGEKEPQSGENMEFIGRVEPSGQVVTSGDIRTYLLDLGAKAEFLDKEGYLSRYTIQDMEKALLFTADQMRGWLGVGGNSGQRSMPAVSGASYGDQDFRGGPPDESGW